MALLVYSDKCKHSQGIIAFIKAQPSLLEIIRFHNVSTHGVPSNKITRVPTLVTNEGKMCVGGEVKTWLESMIPTTFCSWDASGSLCTNIDGTDSNDTFFETSKYGESLEPTWTPELEERISMSVTDAYQKARQG
jgi:hypothetical protein